MFTRLRIAAPSSSSRVVINPNTAKNYKSATYPPLTPAEQAAATAKLASLDRATPERSWFNTDDEIDCATLGFLRSSQVPFDCKISWGLACGLALVPAHSIVASQSSIKVQGLAAYIQNEKLSAPVVMEYADHPHWQVLAGHTRIRIQMLAGRTHITALVVCEADCGKVKRLNWVE